MAKRPDVIRETIRIVVEVEVETHASDINASRVSAHEMRRCNRHAVNGFIRNTVRRAAVMYRDPISHIISANEVCVAVPRAKTPTKSARKKIAA